MRKLTLVMILTISIITSLSLKSQSSLLWKVSGNGLEKESYIYGTIHLICPQDFSMNDKVKNAFSKTEQVYLEIDFDDPQMMQKMMGFSMLPDGKTAKDYLSIDDYKLYDEKFKSSIGMQMAQIQTLKPLMLLSMTYVSLLKCQPMSFETVISKMANESGMEVKGLETIEYQMSVFDKIPYVKQYEMITAMLKDEQSALDEFKSLVSLYKNEDINGMLELMKESEMNTEEFEEFILNKRNIEWIEKLGDIFSSKSTFIAVGAGHLAGESGVIKLLKKKGYTVEPVMQ